MNSLLNSPHDCQILPSVRTRRLEKYLIQFHCIRNRQILKQNIHVVKLVHQILCPQLHPHHKSVQFNDLHEKKTARKPFSSCPATQVLTGLGLRKLATTPGESLENSCHTEGLPRGKRSTLHFWKYLVTQCVVSLTNHLAPFPFR